MSTLKHLSLDYTCRILSMSVCLGRNLCIKLPISMRSLSFFGFWKNDLSGLGIVSDITPSWNGEFSSMSKLILAFWLFWLTLLVFCWISEGLWSRSGCNGTSGKNGLSFCRRLVFSGTVHWFWSKTSFQLLL